MRASIRHCTLSPSVESLHLPHRSQPPSSVPRAASPSRARESRSRMLGLGCRCGAPDSVGMVCSSAVSVQVVSQSRQMSEALKP